MAATNRATTMNARSRPAHRDAAGKDNRTWPSSCVALGASATAVPVVMPHAHVAYRRKNRPGRIRRDWAGR
jgi:hypothetical protein